MKSTDQMSVMVLPKQRLQRLRFEPFRLFFPLGALLGCDGVATWWAYAWRMTPVYHSYQHALIQMLVFVPAFITGFFLTFLPRFTHTPVAGWGLVVSLTAVLLAIDGLIHAGQWALAYTAHGVWVILLVSFIVSRGRAAAKQHRADPDRKKTPPLEMIWFPFGCMIALISDAGMMAHHTGRLNGAWLLVFKALAEQGLVFATVIGVAGFMIPRLSGSYRSCEHKNKETNLSEDTPCSRIRPASETKGLALLHITAVLLFFSGYPAVVFLHPTVGWAIKTAALMIVWSKARIWLPPRHGGTYLWGAYASCLLFTAGFIGNVILPAYRIAWLHVTFIGGITVMILCIAHMIIQVHAARSQELNRFMSWLWVILGLTVVAMILRLHAVFDLDRYFQWLGTASLLWTLAWLAWLITQTKALITFPDGDPFGELHDKEVAAASASNQTRKHG